MAWIELVFGRHVQDEACDRIYEGAKFQPWSKQVEGEGRQNIKLQYYCRTLFVLLLFCTVS